MKTKYPVFYVYYSFGADTPSEIWRVERNRSFVRSFINSRLQSDWRETANIFIKAVINKQEFLRYGKIKEISKEELALLI